VRTGRKRNEKFPQKKKTDFKFLYYRRRGERDDERNDNILIGYEELGFIILEL
jgi:hypothetical protein